jgi:hypothetical protein
MTGEEQLETLDELRDYTKQVIEKLMKGEITVSQGRALRAAAACYRPRGAHRRSTPPRAGKDVAMIDD